jgi:hypothetical protein
MDQHHTDFLQYPFSHLQSVHFRGERIPVTPLILTQQQVTSPLGRVVRGVLLVVRVVGGRAECLRQPAHRLRRPRCHVLRRRDGGHLSQGWKKPGFFWFFFLFFFLGFWFFFGFLVFFFFFLYLPRRESF